MAVRFTFPFDVAYKVAARTKWVDPVETRGSFVRRVVYTALSWNETTSTNAAILRTRHTEDSALPILSHGLESTPHSLPKLIDDVGSRQSRGQPFLSAP